MFPIEFEEKTKAWIYIQHKFYLRDKSAIIIT
jgi:hypothetical protein